MNPFRWIVDWVWKSDWQWFWIKSSFHFAGGLIIGLVSLFHISVWLTVVLFSALVTTIVTKELIERTHQPIYKTVGDMLSWVIGFWSVAWAKFM
jgi:hypothetical protein